MNRFVKFSLSIFLLALAATFAFTANPVAYGAGPVGQKEFQDRYVERRLRQLRQPGVQRRRNDHGRRRVRRADGTQDGRRRVGQHLGAAQDSAGRPGHRR